MNKKNAIIIISLIILIIISIIIIKRESYVTKHTINKTVCKDKEFQLSLILQSGEKGTLYINDNHCELPPTKNQSELSIKILDDGAVQDSLYLSKLYVWLRDPSKTVEEQIKFILNNRFNKKNRCLVEKNQYTQYDKLYTYSAYVDTKENINNLPDDYCFVFGKMDEYSSEVYISTNNVLIAKRQDGSDGIGAFNLASVRFVKE